MILRSCSTFKRWIYGKQPVSASGGSTVSLETAALPILERRKMSQEYQVVITASSLRRQVLSLPHSALILSFQIPGNPAAVDLEREVPNVLVALISYH